MHGDFARMAAAAVATGVVIAVTVSPGPRSAGASRSSAPPPVGIVARGSAWTLQALDPRTLAPASHGWSLPVMRGTRLVRSPLGIGVAAVGPRITRYLDSRTGKPLRVPTVGLEGAAPVASTDLYWLGGEQFGRADATVVAGIEDASSGPNAGWSYALYALNRPSDIAPGIGQPLAGPDDVPWTVFPKGLIGTIGADLGFVPPTETGRIRTLLSPAMSNPAMTVDVAADIPRDRLFVINADGTIAEIDHVSGRPHVTYHHVPLNGNAFASAYAGHDKIALWGADGLGIIDTRTWSTQALDSRLHNAVVTPYGIVAWTYDTRSPCGLWLYPLEGGGPYTVFETKIIPSPQRTRSFAPTALGPYLYFNLTGGHRYSLDLATHRLVGPVNTNVISLALPSYIRIR